MKHDLSGVWIFTFGSGHVHEGKYVRIPAPDREIARVRMIQRFGLKFSMQYTEADWVQIARRLGPRAETPLTEKDRVEI